MAGWLIFKVLCVSNQPQNTKELPGQISVTVVKKHRSGEVSKEPRNRVLIEVKWYKAI